MNKETEFVGQPEGYVSASGDPPSSWLSGPTPTIKPYQNKELGLLGNFDVSHRRASCLNGSELRMMPKMRRMPETELRQQP